VAENPTRGLDVQATRTVHDRLREAAAAGLAVLLHSTDLDEVLAIGSRVVVLASGRLLVPATVDRATVGALMLRGTGGADA
jgi:simple sugar transport system ATP-binding protein